MTKAEIIDYLYDNNVQGDCSIEQIAEDLGRPQGKWLLSDLQSQVDNDNGNYVYVCTNCNHTDIHAKTQKVPYCWWCGAQMKGENYEVSCR